MRFTGKYFMCITCAVFLLLGACSPAVPDDYDTITVSLVESPGCFVPVNGQKIRSGEDVIFELILEKGYAFSSVDYDGEYQIEIINGTEHLRLLDVRYPTRAGLRLTSHYRTIVYDGNGAAEPSITRTYDMTFHTRPNTGIGTDWYSREGYTLTGWNTKADGSGVGVGLGSRVSVPDIEGLTLYAQWAKWSKPDCFAYTVDRTVTITGYHGDEETVVIPAMLDGKPVTEIASGAFQNCTAKAVIFPKTLEQVEERAFQDCSIQSLTLFDTIENIGSSSFENCKNFTTLHINAAEPPFGYGYRRESCLADKIDLLLKAKGEQKIVFYGGCSMWYNLDGPQAQEAFEGNYRVINAGLNGTINSAVQMQIIMSYLEEGDIFFHTPELSSGPQLFLEMGFSENDAKLWCGLEYNYDMVTAVDLRDFPEFLDSFRHWLDTKEEAWEKGEAEGSYEEYYTDEQGRPFFDLFGGIPFERTESLGGLADEVYLDPVFIRDDSMERLNLYYQTMIERGVTVYVSYACINMDEVPGEQQGNVLVMDELFRKAVADMENVTLISRLPDYLYWDSDFFDTNYHLTSKAASHNTALWLRDLLIQMKADGLWEGGR